MANPYNNNNYNYPYSTPSTTSTSYAVASTAPMTPPRGGFVSAWSESSESPESTRDQATSPYGGSVQALSPESRARYRQPDGPTSPRHNPTARPDVNSYMNFPHNVNPPTASAASRYYTLDPRRTWVQVTLDEHGRAPTDQSGQYVQLYDETGTQIDLDAYGRPTTSGTVSSSTANTSASHLSQGGRYPPPGAGGSGGSAGMSAGYPQQNPYQQSYQGYPPTFR